MLERKADLLPHPTIITSVFQQGEYVLFCCDCRNVTLQQAEELESAVNLMSLPLQEVGSGGGVADSETRQPLARRVKVGASFFLLEKYI